MAKFKEGDRVRQVERTGPGMEGDEFTVLRVDDYVHVDDYGGWDKCRFELVSTTFKVGDRVKRSTTGALGTVHGLQESATVKWDNGPIMLAPVSELVAAPGVQKTRGQIVQELRKVAGLPEFVVGDVVRWNYCDNDWNESLVTSIDGGNDTWCLHVEDRKNGIGVLPFNNTTLITPAPAAPAIAPQSPALLFNIGDYVRVNGRVGQIDDVDDGDEMLPYLVTWLGEFDGAWLGADEVEKWTPKAGDRVVLTEEFEGADAGSTGTVYAANRKETWGLDYEVYVIIDGHFKGHYGDANDDSMNHHFCPQRILAPTTDEPEVAPATQFKRGDVVEITNSVTLL